MTRVAGLRALEVGVRDGSAYAVSATERTPGGRCAAAEPSDGELAARVRHGDAEAFGRIYDRHAADVFAYVQMRVRDAPLAEDLTQDVFASAWQAMPRFVWRGDLSPWLLRLAHNRVANHWRSVGRRPEPDALPDDDGGNGSDFDEEDLAGIAHRRNLAESLDGALAQLGDVEREVLALRFGAGLSVRDTARTTGRSENSVRSTQYRAVRRLAALMRAEEEWP